MAESWLQKLRKQRVFPPHKIRAARARRIGCANCAPLPKEVLPQGARLYADWATIIEERCVAVDTSRDESRTPRVGDLARAHCTDPSSRYFLRTETPLHSETYEWDLARGRWVLLGQGHGYA